MARCTAPVQGHRSASARANCPACGGGGYSSRPYYPPISYPSPPTRSIGSTGGSGSGGGGSSHSSARPRWSPSTSTLIYTDEQRRALTPIREQVELRAAEPGLHDLFLCHAWDDRQTVAKELHNLIEAKGASVWFSEKNIALGTPWLREIDKGLAKSRVGLVLVTPAFLRRLEAGGVSELELADLLRREQLIPVLHGVTFEELVKVSPLLASRQGMNTQTESMESIAGKIAELVDLSVN
ncbi:toll/interleukin-1 receptor domain-containing protein [Deinococcus soli (ex Cha et al. 2016)]|uniref:toll/interleukin-1 receptor domain-containing protein n=1 Tax=Deinococcus soli (ex Cha et al. 2016) TaxID=1309411 RepID=UPI001663E476|nr:toll/interleukin-1 receptor domain-containing protein [Deinococcus soli (ex Cha et al. 2016)]GGB81691.1 TIR domain-containing protein [Deinococcus soli (ex Cha et al. 2016)]